MLAVKNSSFAAQKIYFALLRKDYFAGFCSPKSPFEQKLSRLTAFFVHIPINDMKCADRCTANIRQPKMQDKQKNVAEKINLLIFGEHRQNFLIFGRFT